MNPGISIRNALVPISHTIKPTWTYPKLPSQKNLYNLGISIIHTHLLHSLICSSLVEVSISCEISQAFLTSAGRFDEKKCSMAGVDASRLTPFLTSWLARFFLARESSRPHFRHSVTSSDVIGPSSSVGNVFYR